MTTQTLVSSEVKGADNGIGDPEVTAKQQKPDHGLVILMRNLLSTR